MILEYPSGPITIEIEVGELDYLAEDDNRSAREIFEEEVQK